MINVCFTHRSCHNTNNHNKRSPVKVMSIASYLSLRVDSCLGISDKDLIRWNVVKEYTNDNLPHYVNHFMLHIIEGYLETGEY